MNFADRLHDELIDDEVEMIRDMDINHPHEPYTKARRDMIGTWNRRHKMVQEAQDARAAFAVHHSPRSMDIPEWEPHQQLNLRMYRAIEELSDLLDEKEWEIKDLHTMLSGDKIPDAGRDSHPYFKLYRLEYARHLTTKKAMSGGNGEMQRKLKVYEDAVTSLKRTLERV